MEIVLLVLSIIGILLSLYALYVEKKVEKNKNYSAACDINDRMSCTKAFKSGYAKTFGIQNSVLGVVLYLVIIMLLLAGRVDFVFYISVLSIIASIYFAYVLYAKVRSFCVVCHGIYLVNILILIFSYFAVF